MFPCPTFWRVLSVKPWKIESLLQLLLGIFGSITFTGLLAVGLGYTSKPERIDHVMMLVGAVSVHGVGILWLNWFFKDHQINWRAVLCSRWMQLPTMILLGVLFGVLGFYACMYLGGLQAGLFSHFAVETEPQSTIVALQSALSLPWIIFFGIISIIFAPVVEEVLFRGILYPMLKQLGRPQLALWGVSILFAASHANLHAFVPLTLLALGLTWLYEKTDQLIAPIVAHSTFNAINYGLTIQFGAYSAGGT